MTLWRWSSARWRRPPPPRRRPGLPALCCASAPKPPAFLAPPPRTSEPPDGRHDALTAAETHQSAVCHTSWSRGRLAPLTLEQRRSPGLPAQSRLLGGRSCSTSVCIDGDNGQTPADMWPQLRLLVLLDEGHWLHLMTEKYIHTLHFCSQLRILNPYINDYFHYVLIYWEIKTHSNVSIHLVNIQNSVYKSKTSREWMPPSCTSFGANVGALMIRLNLKQSSGVNHNLSAHFKSIRSLIITQLT